MLKEALTYEPLQVQPRRWANARLLRSRVQLSAALCRQPSLDLDSSVLFTIAHHSMPLSTIALSRTDPSAAEEI
jgi:hypothetical protein